VTLRSGPSSVMTTPTHQVWGCLRKQKDQRVRFYRIKERPCGLLGRPGTTCCTLYVCGTSRPFGPQRCPGKIDAAGPTGNKGRIGAHWAAMGIAPLGAKPRQSRLPAAMRLWRAHTAAISSPRTRFARARSRGPFSHFFELTCCRFEISIRRPEAHFAQRGSIGTTVSMLF
jgi:hypothetical protein